MADHLADLSLGVEDRRVVASAEEHPDLPKLRFVICRARYMQICRGRATDWLRRLLWRSERRVLYRRRTASMISCIETVRPGAVARSRRASFARPISTGRSQSEA